MMRRNRRGYIRIMSNRSGNAGKNWKRLGAVTAALMKKAMPTATNTAADIESRPALWGTPGGENTENGSGGRVRTDGLLVMSQASYRCSTPQEFELVDEISEG